MNPAARRDVAPPPSSPERNHAETAAPGPKRGRGNRTDSRGSARPLRHQAIRTATSRPRPDARRSRRPPYGSALGRLLPRSEWHSSIRPIAGVRPLKRIVDGSLRGISKRWSSVPQILRPPSRTSTTPRPRDRQYGYGNVFRGLPSGQPKGYRAIVAGRRYSWAGGRPAGATAAISADLPAKHHHLQGTRTRRSSDNFNAVHEEERRLILEASRADGSPLGRAQWRPAAARRHAPLCGSGKLRSGRRLANSPGNDARGSPQVPQDAGLPRDSRFHIGSRHPRKIRSHPPGGGA
jgi:hypothetical protein